MRKVIKNKMREINFSFWFFIIFVLFVCVFTFKLFKNIIKEIKCDDICENSNMNFKSYDFDSESCICESRNNLTYIKYYGDGK